MKKILCPFATIILVTVFQMLPIKSVATNIDELTARQYSKYYLSVMSGNKEVEDSEVILAYTFMNDSLNIPAAYVFNIEGQGFVIISGSDLWYPILGYSTNDLFDINRAPASLKWYFEGLCKYISYSQNTNIALINNIEKEWKDLQRKTLPSVRSPKSSEWLLDCTWGQGNSLNPTYNKFCPSRTNNYGFQETALTGCVATAMSQIMYYWKYPVEPVEDTLRYLGCMVDDVNFGDIIIDMSSVAYNFDTMPNQLTLYSNTTEIDAVALLCYHAGVSVEMSYGLYGSGAPSHKVPQALSDVFLYDTNAELNTRVYNYPGGIEIINFTNDEWITMLSNEIVANRPVYYAGGSSDSNGNYVDGHAFVCDGHNTTDPNKFHFNWGWDGMYDMWCDVRNNEIGPDDMYFGYCQDIVRNIKPRPEPTCDNLVLGSMDVDYDCATLTWTGGAVNYQILYKEASATTWSDTCISTRHQYTIENLVPQTDYMVKIRSLCHSGEGHSMWIDTTFSTTEYCCRVPQNIVVNTDISNTSIEITWRSRATQWLVNLYCDDWFAMDTVDWQPLTYVEIAEGEVCHLSMKSICGENDMSEWSDTISFVVGIHPDVMNIETIMPYCESAFLMWEGNALNYQLLYKEVSATTWSDTITTSNRFYTLTNLVPETNYMVKIRALYNSAAGYSEWSNDTIFSTEAFMCNVPTNVAAEVLSYESVNITWDSDGDVANWIVSISNDTQNYIDTVDQLSFTKEGLTIGTEYSVAVRSLCYANVTSDWSDTITFSTWSCPEVRDITASNITATSAVINWSSADAIKWDLSIGVEINPGEGDFYELNESTFTATGLQPHTIYDVYVRLYCAEDSYGKWSNKLTFMTERGEDPEAIDGVDNDFYFDVYPNPTHGSATIFLNGVEGKVEISVVDINGRIVINEGIECGRDCEKTLNVDSLTPGTYFVKVVGNTINSVRKLIVR